MDIEEEQIKKVQKSILKFMGKDRGNLKYLNLAVVFIGFLTYLWAVDELDENPYWLLPFIVIGFGGVIIYLSWHWKKGPGAIYLDKIENLKNVGISNPKSFDYWLNLEKELVSANTFPTDDNKVIHLAETILSQRVELENSPNVLGYLMLSAAQSMRATSLFNLGRYNEAKTAYEAIIQEKTTEGSDCSNEIDILKQCITKLSTISNQISTTPNLLHSQVQTMQSPAKICPYCQTQNTATNNQCELCLSQI
jgi:hypothetical protein